MEKIVDLNACALMVAEPPSTETKIYACDPSSYPSSRLAASSNSHQY